MCLSNFTTIPDPFIFECTEEISKKNGFNIISYKHNNLMVLLDAIILFINAFQSSVISEKTFLTLSLFILSKL